MGDNISLVRANEAQALTQLLETAERSEEIDLHGSGETVSAITDEYIVVIDSHTFIRECIRRSMQSALHCKFKLFQTLSNCSGNATSCQN